MKRNIEFDLFRAIIIINALFLHFNRRYYIGLLAKPSIFIQDNIFTVGGVFFFISGYMARKVYLPKFVQNAPRTSARIFLKGLKILAIYLLYVFFMHILTSTKLPNTFGGFIYEHRFFTTVLFPFGLLFMLTPAILYLTSKNNGVAAGMFLVMCLVVLFYDKSWLVSSEIRRTFIDRKLYLYPLIHCLIIYAFGYVAGAFDKMLSNKIVPGKLAVISVGLICANIMLLNIIPVYFGFTLEKQYFTFIESVTPFLFILIARYLLTLFAAEKNRFFSAILCLGRQSLTFYVGSNFILGLLTLSVDSQPVIKLLAIASIGALAYLVTYWHDNVVLSTKLSKN